jgi:hypothetical protein
MQHKISFHCTKEAFFKTLLMLAQKTQNYFPDFFLSQDIFSILCENTTSVSGDLMKTVLLFDVNKNDGLGLERRERIILDNIGDCYRITDIFTAICPQFFRGSAIDSDITVSANIAENRLIEFTISCPNEHIRKAIETIALQDYPKFE